MTMGDEKKETRQQKAAAKARLAAASAIGSAFKAYQRFQVADCVAKDITIDAGDLATFADWVADELRDLK